MFERRRGAAYLEGERDCTATITWISVKIKDLSRCTTQV